MREMAATDLDGSREKSTLNRISGYRDQREIEAKDLVGGNHSRLARADDCAKQITMQKPTGNY